jgi:hypothetical protein
VKAQGWYRDPFGIHGDRWFSEGPPADLVRDDDVVSRDAPPDGEVPTPLVPAEERPADSSDTKRADAATRKDQSYDGRAAFIAAVGRILGQGPIG